MYKFQDLPTTRNEFITILNTLDEVELDPNAKAYIVGLLAKFGETDRDKFISCGRQVLKLIH